MDRFDDDTLFAELQAMRPAPRPEFTADLDERAAAGFPRRESPSAAATPFARLLDRWRAMSPGRRLVPTLAGALVALVVATAVVAIAQSGTKSNPSDEAVVGMVPGAGESGRSAEAFEESAPAHTTGRHAAGNGGSHSSGAAGGGGARDESSETVYEAEVPAVESSAMNGRKKSGKATAGPATTTSNGGVKGEAFTEEGGEEAGAESEEEAPAEEAGGVEHAGEESAEAEVFAPQAAPTPALPQLAPLPFAGHRDIERSAYVVLGTKPGEVAGAASKVYEAVHAAKGIVLHSSVQSGNAGATGASFELLIPSGKLDDALAAFSQIAEVRERHDATNDITKPTVGAAEELADSNASIEGLLKELGDAETETEREAVEARLREERRRHAAIEGSLEHLHKRASMSEVSVRIVTDNGAGVTPPVAKSNDSGDWSVGDALHDAGHILQIAAGILLIALAVLAPIALILLLVWLANRFRVRRLRERTLG
jgi:Domain of unknown function (DUF4349)